MMKTGGKWTSTIVDRLPCRKKQNGWCRPSRKQQDGWPITRLHFSWSTSASGFHHALWRGGGVDNSVHKQTVCRSHRKQLICNFRINFVAQIRVRRACIISLDMNTIFFERQQKEICMLCWVSKQTSNDSHCQKSGFHVFNSIFLSFYCICLVKKSRQQDKGLC